LTLPVAPSNLTSETVSQSTVKLQWTDNSNNEDGFRIYRDNSLIATVGAGFTTYQNTDLQPATTYRYAVRAFNQAGESEAATCTVATQNPPLNVRLDYFGIISNFAEDDWDGPTGEIQLVAVITDGKVTEEVYLPPDRGVFEMWDFKVCKLNQPVFHTSSVGDFLKVSILAYDVDDQDKLFQFADMGEAMGIPEAKLLNLLLSFMPQEDDRIGYYEYVWYPQQNWGIGQYQEEGNEHLRLWFSIWSDTEPPLISEPPLLPDVRIQKVDLPSEAKNMAGRLIKTTYYHTLTLVNNEPIDVTIDWKVSFMQGGEYYGWTPTSGSVIVGRNGGVATIRKDYYYVVTGTEKVTYTISYKGTELESWSGTVNVIP